MWAAVLRMPGALVLAEKSVPAVGPGQAVIRVATALIGEEDLAIFEGDPPVESGLTLGWRGAGIVEELGEGVRRFRPGDRVLVDSAMPALRGEENAVTNGLHAEYALIRHADLTLIGIPDGLSDEWALILAGGLSPAHFPTHTLGLRDAALGYAMMRSKPKGAVRVALKMNPRPS